MPADDFEELDYAHVREQIFPSDWTPDPLPSEAWRGLVQENSYLVPDPAPTGRLEAPTVYAAWKLDYDDFESDYGGEGAPVRYGRLTVARFIEKGAKKGPLRKLRTAILRRLLDVPDEPLGFDVQKARSVTVGYSGPWFVENLVIPFCGG